MSEKADVLRSQDGTIKQFHVLKDVGKDGHVTLQITIEENGFCVFFQDSKTQHNRIVSSKFNNEILEKLRDFINSK